MHLTFKYDLDPTIWLVTYDDLTVAEYVAAGEGLGEVGLQVGGVDVKLQLVEEGDRETVRTVPVLGEG